MFEKGASAMFAKINYESLALFAKFGGAMLGLLLTVWLIALLTPKAAKLIDRLLHRKSGGEPNPARGGEPPRAVSPPQLDTVYRTYEKPPQGGGEENYNEENYKVYSIFEDRPKGAVNGAVKNDKEENKNG